MTIASFQQALADLVASPAFCLAVREDAAPALADYALSELELKRLRSIVWQRGMSANCTVHRATRVTPIYTLLPLTCALLEPNLTTELNQYWSAFPRMEIRFDLEISRFAGWLSRRLKEGLPKAPHDLDAIASVLAIELICEKLRLSPRCHSQTSEARDAMESRSETVRLNWNPLALLKEAGSEHPRFDAVPRGEHLLVVAMIDDEIKIAVDGDTPGRLDLAES